MIIKNMFNWEKRGFLYKPDTNLYWQQSHCQNPTVEFLNPNLVRIYFASRDKNNRAYAGFFDYDLYGKSVIFFTEDPILIPEFDHEKDGVYISSVLSLGDIKYIYYLGFISLGYANFTATINLAFYYNKTGKIEKYKKNPILTIDEVDPYLVTNPTVLKNNDLFYMFYSSGLRKQFIEKMERLFYTIKLAISKDGINFEKTNKVIFPLNDNEIALTRLALLYDTEFMRDYIYKGWYSYIKKGFPYRKEYRIGFALSNDLINWYRRDDLVRIDVGPEEYDIDMMAYPQVFRFNNKLFMLYNGNNFGKDGILYAISDIPKV